MMPNLLNDFFGTFIVINLFPLPLQFFFLSIAASICPRPKVIRELSTSHGRVTKSSIKNKHKR